MLSNWNVTTLRGDPVTIKINLFFMFGIFWGTFQFLGFLSRFCLKKKWLLFVCNSCRRWCSVVVVGAWGTRCTMWCCVCVCVYLVYVVLYGKKRKRWGATGLFFSSYQGTRSNESRKPAKYFTKYCTSQNAVGDWDCSKWLHVVINCNMSIRGFFISLWLF